MEFRAVNGVVISLLASGYIILCNFYWTWTFGERNTVNTGLFLFVLSLPSASPPPLPPPSSSSSAAAASATTAAAAGKLMTLFALAVASEWWVGLQINVGCEPSNEATN